MRLVLAAVNFPPPLTEVDFQEEMSLTCWQNPPPPS